MRNGFLIFLFVGLLMILTACNSEQRENESTALTAQAGTTATAVATQTVQPTVTVTEQAAASPEIQNPATEPTQTNVSQEQPQEIQSGDLQMTIGGTAVSVAWEDNDAVQSLKELCRNRTLTIDMSMYGGFEQVGSIGSSLPQNDEQTTTAAGDIVLYSGNQIVVFYGSNTWAYTRLGHIIDKTPDELTSLLSGGDVTITLTY